ncbi:MAG: hypothetical protein ACUZ8I_07765 [Candidatus Scalindua sp.]
MGTDNLTLGGTTSRLPSDSGMPSFFHLEKTIDFSVAANSVSGADILQVIPIPAGAFVLGAYVNAITNETSTALLGDGANTGGYLGTFCDLNITVTYVSGAGVTVLSTTVTETRGVYGRQGGKYYPLADTLDLIPTSALNTAKVKVGMWGFMMNKPPTDA